MDLVGGQFGVGVGESLELGIDGLLVEWVDKDALTAALVHGDASGATGDAGWGHDVIEDGGVDSLQGAGAWSHLGCVADGYTERDEVSNLARLRGEITYHSGKGWFCWQP